MAFEHGKVNRDRVAAENPTEGSVEFRPKVGTSQVRILPPHPTSNVWFHKSNEHWVDGHGYVPCGRGFGRPCPICEEGEALYSSQIEENVKMAISLRPREQYYYNVIVFTSADGKVSPKDGVRIMRTGVKIFKNLRNLDNDEAGGWGDMTNTDTGFNVSIARAGNARENTEYSVTPVPNRQNKSLEVQLAAHGVDLNTLELLNLSDYAQMLALEYDDLKTRFENKQVAPGFPGGPRLSHPHVVGTLPDMPKGLFDHLKNAGEVVPPPFIEE